MRQFSVVARAACDAGGGRSPLYLYKGHITYSATSHIVCKGFSLTQENMISAGGIEALLIDCMRLYSVAQMKYAASHPLLNLYKV